MPEVVPFVALRFDPTIAGPLESLVSPPYDIVSPGSSAALLAKSPYNVVRLEGDAGGADDGDHARAGELIRSWRSRGVLVPTPSSFFAYEMSYEFGGASRTTRGLLAGLGVEPWGGSVIPHEAISGKPVSERLGRLRAVNANLSPIHVVSSGPSPVVTAALSAAAERPSAAEVRDDEGVVHRMWVLDPDARITEELARQTCMIADGHHRYTTALAYREEMRQLHGPGAWDQVLAFIVDAGEGSPVLPFHRVILAGDLPAPQQVAASLEETLAAVLDDTTTVGVVRRSGDAVTYGLITLDAPPPAVEALEPLLPRDEDSVRFTPDPLEADRAVRMREAVGAWLLPPTTASRIRAVIDTGRRLPRKSTYFWPKPRTGFVLRPFD